ncbi:MAG: cyclopropane-fatty-acyl-phospholipid synthase family protein [Actinomycetota bacterium]
MGMSQIDDVRPSETVAAGCVAGGRADDEGFDRRTGVDGPVVEVLGPVIERALGGGAPVEMRFWDGSAMGPSDSVGRIEFRSPDAVRRIVWAPGELGFARAFVAGDIVVSGPLPEVLRALQMGDPHHIGLGVGDLPDLIRAARRVGAFGRPPAAPPEEMVAHGRRHSVRRDRRTVRHHYDVGNRFYELILGSSMTYSCARFTDADSSLVEAQAAKHELVCRKVGLAESDRRGPALRPRLLDVGCGWGEMAIHAAGRHDADVVGVTISPEQAHRARERVAAAGLADRVDIRIQDYRRIDDGPFDAISSIGMAEHVGRRNMESYFRILHDLLRPGGRIMNHAIASVGGSRISHSSFVGRYVFPDGELLDVADTVRCMEAAGLEVRDVENLREHYARTLRAWVGNLERRWDEAVALVGVRRARIWRLYMSGSINGFDDRGLQLQQTLGVKLHPDGSSEMPPTRTAWG